MWKQNTNTTGWDIKYYKGLGTSTREEAKEYFADIEEHRKTFVWAGTFALVSVLGSLPFPVPCGLLAVIRLIESVDSVPS